MTSENLSPEATEAVDSLIEAFRLWLQQLIWFPGCLVTDVTDAAAGWIVCRITADAGGTVAGGNQRCRWRQLFEIAANDIVDVLYDPRTMMFEIFKPGGGAGVATHDLLGVMHGDTTTDAPTQGSIVKGDATPEWDELVVGAARQILQVNAGGTDFSWLAFDWDLVNVAAGADMAHDHSSAAEGDQDLRQIQELEFDDATILTIDGAGAVVRTQVYHIIAANAGVADNLDNATGGLEGDKLIIRPDAGDTITVRHNQGGAGDFWFTGGADIVLDNQDHLELVHDGTSWCDVSGGAAAGGNTLDQAYDQGGAGVGRAITADTGAVDISDDGLDVSNVELYDATVITIDAAGTATKTQSYHAIAANTGIIDDLVQIDGGVEGDLLVIWPDTGDQIVVHHNEGGAGDNIWLAGGVDITLGGQDHLVLIFNGAWWCDLSGGTTPSHRVLSNPPHIDTVTTMPVQGSIIVGNATPLWDDLPIGVALRILESDGTDPSWVVTTDGQAASTVIRTSAASGIQPKRLMVASAVGIPGTDGELRCRGSAEATFGAHVDSVRTNNIATIAELTHLTAGLVAAGFGGRLIWKLEDAGGNQDDGGAIDVVWADPTDTTEDSYIALLVRVGGAALTEICRVDGLGILMAGDKYVDGNFRYEDATELTIAAGSVTKVQSYHRIDTQGDAATDDLDTIAGGVEGDILIVRDENAARDVKLTEAGNIVIPSGPDLWMGDDESPVALIHDGSNWLNFASPHGRWNLIKEEELDGLAASITFANIPQIYRMLALVLHTRGDRAVESQAIWAQCNADAGNNYLYVEFYTTISVGPSRGGNRVTNRTLIGLTECANARANCFNGTVSYWYNYASATHEKYHQSFSVAYGNRDNDADCYVYYSTGAWQNVNAITTLAITPSANNFVAGTVVALYGVL